MPFIIPHLDPILEDLEKEGYDFRAYLIPASAVGAPHKRERLWIIADRNGIRCDYWANTREERHVQGDFERHIETLQSEWAQFKHLAWEISSAEDWLSLNAEISRADDGTAGRLDRLKAIGNSVVPQIPYLLMMNRWPYW